MLVDVAERDTERAPCDATRFSRYAVAAVTLATPLA